jgi:5-amino-6-(5-phosphoribosylamino)uracil reductase
MSDFAHYVARKEAEAARAVLPLWKTDDVGAVNGLHPIGNDWSRALFDGDFFVSPSPSDDLPATSLVFVQSREGNTVATDPSTLGGGETDKHVVYEGLSRVAADAVMAGAETVRDGGIVFSVWHPELVALRRSLGLPRHPTQIVATLRGLKFGGTRLFDEPSLRVVVLTVPSCSDVMDAELERRPWITRVVMPKAGDLPHAFRELRRLGIERISCVGGRTLARQLLDARLIQDVYLTKSPKSGGQPNTPLEIGDADLVVRKRGTDADTGVVFEHRQL